MREIFKTEIERAILSTSQAYGLGSAVLFDREVDSQILSRSGSVLDSKHQMSTVGLLNLLVPYIKGLPPERLTELREKMPSAFIDFRGILLHVVTEAISKGETTQVQLQEKIERQLLPSLRQLQSEQRAALIKAKREIIGTSAIWALATLAGSYLAGPSSSLFVLGATSGAAAAVVKSIAELGSANKKAEGHPFYFLWKAGISI